MHRKRTPTPRRPVIIAPAVLVQLQLPDALQPIMRQNLLQSLPHIISNHLMHPDTPHPLPLKIHRERRHHTHKPALIPRLAEHTPAAAHLTLQRPPHLRIRSISPHSPRSCTQRHRSQNPIHRHPKHHLNTRYGSSAPQPLSQSRQSLAAHHTIRHHAQPPLQPAHLLAVNPRHPPPPSAHQ